MITLNQAIIRMRILAEEGYEVYFEGRGDGIVVPVAEYYEIVNTKNKKENKNKGK